MGVPSYEGILDNLRSVMQQTQQQGAGLSKHDLKIRMERCFIDMRREFEVLCLECGLYD